MRFFTKDSQDDCLKINLPQCQILSRLATINLSNLPGYHVLIFFIKLENQIDINNSRLRYARQMRFFAKVSLDNYLKVILTSMSNLVSIGHNLPFKSARVPYFDFFLLNLKIKSTSITQD